MKVKLTHRRSRVLRATLLGCSPLAFASSTAAFAAPPPHFPPTELLTDENGIDLATGKIVAPPFSITVGDPSSGSMSYVRSIVPNAVWTDNLQYTLQPPTANDTKIYVSSGNKTQSYSNSGGIYYSDSADGSKVSLSGGTYVYTGRDGTVIEFVQQGDLAYSPYAIYRPDGEVLTFHYKTGTVTYNGSPTTFVRRQSVVSSRGFQVKFSYLLNSMASSSDIPGFTSLSSVRAINNGIDFCNPSADSCSYTYSWPSLSIATSGSGPFTESITDNASRTTVVTRTADTVLGVRLPGSVVDDVSASYAGTPGASWPITVVANGITHSYATAPGGTATINGTSVPVDNRTISVAGTVIRSAKVGVFNGDPVITSQTDGLNRTTYFDYGAFGRLRTVSAPEGNYTLFTYDARGNIIQTSRVAKGAALATLHTYAAFDGTCANAKTCNQPIWTRDELNNQTDYTYEAATGQIKTVTRPAAAAGQARPQVRFSYEQRYAYRKDGNGNIGTAGPPISVLTETSTCLSGTSCTGTAEERRTVVTYQPGSASSASNILPVSTTTRAGDNAVSSTTTVAYDQVGNIVSADGPLSGPAESLIQNYSA